ncbi:MAG: hypothetical protein JG781_631 [Peptococcaceae bacterium]|nr:hypothetical protein [Peptococcaceae bacterium]
MVVQFLESIQEFSSLGLYLSMLLEGSSLPFPGMVVILAIGNLMSPGFNRNFKGEEPTQSNWFYPKNIFKVVYI